MAGKRWYTIKQEQRPQVELVVKNGKRHEGVEAQLAEELRRQVEELTPEERDDLRIALAKRSSPRIAAIQKGRAFVLEKDDGSTTVVSDGGTTRLDVAPRKSEPIEKSERDADLEYQLAGAQRNGNRVTRLIFGD